MGFLPALDITLYSRRTPEDVLTILQSVTVQKKRGFIVSADCEFIGVIAGMEFKIIPNLWYQNCFRPVIKGRVEAEENGAGIRIQMRMHWFTSGFAVIWSLLAAFFLLMGVLMAFADGISEWWIMTAAPAGMLLFEQIIMRFGFYRPARNAIRRLAELLDAAVLDEPGNEAGGAKERGEGT